MIIIQRIFLGILFMSPIILAKAQSKHALLVGISQYGSETGWRSIDGTNDIDLIKPLLKGFSVKELKNSKATYYNIIHELNRLEGKIKSGDIVYIHLSGHGQPFEDEDGDESDGWDESFVPFDAPIFYEKNGYTGDKHITDDILNYHLELMRNKLGKSGFLYVCIDACHAGDSYREANETIYRGTGRGFSKNGKEYKASKNKKIQNRIKSDSKKSPVIILEACQSYQTNAEVKIGKKLYGPLSYSVYKVLITDKIDKTGKWVNSVPTVMKSVIPSWSKQVPVIESSINL